MTLKTFSDELREWELIESEGIDPTDSFGTNLRLSIRENQIYLAEPYDLATPWITDKGRLFFDGLFQKNNFVEKTNWKNFFTDFCELIYFVDHLYLHEKNTFSLIFIFDNVSLEILNILYLINQSCSFVQLKTVEKNKVENDLESNFQLVNSIQKSKLHMSNLGLLIGTNPRYEGYVLNISLRQRFLKGNFKLLTIGSILDLTVPVYNLGSNINVLKSIGEGTHIVCQDIKNSEFPLLVTNMEFFKRSDSNLLHSVFKYINVLDNSWNGFNVLNPNLSSVGMYSLNKILHVSSEDFVSFFSIYSINVSLSSISNVKILIELYLLKILSLEYVLQTEKSTDYKVVPLNCDASLLISQNVNPMDDFFYEKVNGSLIKSYLHLPANMVYEDNETYFNTQGLIKRMSKLIHFKKDAKTNWQLLRKLYSNVKSITFYNNKKDNELIQFDSINSFNFKNYISFQYLATPTLTSLSYYLIKQNSPITKSLSIRFKDRKIKILNTKTKYWLDDFFNTNRRDSFSYNSSVMIDCSKVLRLSSTNFF